MSKIQSKIKDIGLPDKKILIIFTLATAYFLFQHYISLSWDFSSYVENARYLFSDGTYFEPLRPPLMPFLLGLLSIFGFRMAEFVYIILASALFMHSSQRLADSLNFDKVAFYALSLTPYILVNGLYNGTELLSIAFLELSIAMLIRQKSISGLYLGLSALSRYTGLALFPLLFRIGNVKKIAKAFILFGTPLGIWFIYNYLKWGNFFTSIADQYANNILYREYLIRPVEPVHFLIVLNIFAPFFILGLGIEIYNFTKYIYSKRNSIITGIRSTFDDKKAELIMFAVLVFAVISYSNIPIKDSRYLFTLTLPAIYYSYIGIRYLADKIKRPITTVAIIMFLLSFSAILGSEIVKVEQLPIRPLTPYYDTPDRYLDSIGILKDKGLENCSIMSNAWVLMNYLGQTSNDFPRQQFVEDELDRGEIMIMFYSVGEPEYVRDKEFMDLLPTIHKTKEYIILGEKNACLPQEVVDSSYLEKLDDIIYRMQGTHINTNPCIILFGRKPLLERSCNLINMNGFRLDENRWTGA
ncbi:MAG: hypothetical protein KAI18_01290 [Candidatus Aenigmarchaeota archaeon]|nr:hypothetical protein [Candidatus Aenigmarchaeota archaeon]